MGRVALIPAPPVRLNRFPRRLLSFSHALGLFCVAAANARGDDATSTNAPPAPRPSPFLAPPPLAAKSEAPPPLRQPATPNPGAPAENTASTPAPGSTAIVSARGDDQPKFAVPLPPRFADPAGQPGQLAAHLLVVYNAKDPDSESLADYYAKRRAIPPERVLALSCPTSEEITRDQFEQTIRQPILDDFFKHNWMDRRAAIAQIGDRTVNILAATRNDVWAIVLMRGVPLKIAESPSVESGMESAPQLKSDAAAVDSELAMLPIFGLPLGGFVPNPFFDAANTGAVRAGPELATKMILVTRLDGPSPANVRRMIDDCLAAENERLAGSAVIDSRGFTDLSSGYTQGDIWLRRSRDMLASDGWPVLFDDRPATLPATAPLSQVAIYLGWYTPTANGPWITPPDRFVRGAIAYHLHSFSAWTVRSTTQNWVGPLIDHGADATMGNVYEPYLALTPHLDVFTHRLLDGDSFAEAAYASQIGLSWMTTVVGDPLYQPFQKPLDAAIIAAPPGAHRDWLRLQSVDRELDARPPATAAALASQFELSGTGPVLNERLGDLMQKLDDPAAPEAAVQAYALALKQSTEPVDCIRIGLKLAQQYNARDEFEQAQATLAALRAAYPLDATRFGVPRMYEGPRSNAALETGVRPALTDPDAP